MTSLIIDGRCVGEGSKGLIFPASNMVAKVRSSTIPAMPSIRNEGNREKRNVTLALYQYIAV
jgi:hypothetical protein